MQIEDGFEFVDSVTGLHFRVVEGKTLNRLHVVLEQPDVPKIKNRDFFFTRDGKFDGTGSSVCEVSTCDESV